MKTSREVDTPLGVALKDRLLQAVALCARLTGNTPTVPWLTFREKGGGPLCDEGFFHLCDCGQHGL
jgi:hypothetical protein